MQDRMVPRQLDTSPLELPATAKKGKKAPPEMRADMEIEVRETCARGAYANINVLPEDATRYIESFVSFGNLFALIAEEYVPPGYKLCQIRIEPKIASVHSEED